MPARMLGAAVVAVLLSPLAMAEPQQKDDQTCRKASGEAAIAACNRAIASHTFSGAALAAIHNDRGWAYYGIGNVDRAIADYTEAIRINPGDAVAFTNRGIAWHDKRDYDRALADANEAVRLDPTFYFARSIRGLVWHAKGAFDNAIADYAEAIRLDPKDYGARQNRCWTRAAFNRDLEQALADCNEGLRLEPDQPDVLETRGFVYFRMGRMAEAIADYERALKLDPRLPRALFVRALIRHVSGDGAGAKADAAAAAAIQRDIVEEFARYGVGLAPPKK